MGEENNMFGNDNGQQDYSVQPDNNGQSGYAGQPDNNGQSGYVGQPDNNGQGSYNGQPEIDQQGVYSGQSNYNYGGQPYTNQQGSAGQANYGQQQGYQQYNGEQNQQTPLSGSAEPVFQQNNYYNEESQGFGIASMICGILALVTCCFWCLSIPLAIVSIVLGIIQISKGTGKGMAIAGIICSAIGLILMIIFVVFGAVMNSSGFTERYLEEYQDLLEDYQDDSYNYDHHI